MAESMALMAGLVLKDGRRWGEAAANPRISPAGLRDRQVPKALGLRRPTGNLSPPWSGHLDPVRPPDGVERDRAVVE